MTRSCPLGLAPTSSTTATLVLETFLPSACWNAKASPKPIFASAIRAENWALSCKKSLT
ncbi:MAG: hypothetical protein ACLSE6_05115 [Alphaproteobacteria bacterium]